MDPLAFVIAVQDKLFLILGWSIVGAAIVITAIGLVGYFRDQRNH